MPLPLLLLLLLLLPLPLPLPAQRPPLRFLQPTDSLHSGRLWTAIGTGTTAYTGSMIGLYHSWYADYPAGPFHSFNDFNEWNQMDKMGHALMSYNESRWLYSAARWTGIPSRKAAWLGFAGSQLVQTSIEVFDGFSTQWGFSWSDAGFNLLGSSLFLAQQLGWQEQRILLKMSALPVQYSENPIYPSAPTGSTEWTSLQQRADALYGTGPVNLFLKNYNSLVVWFSVNPAAFCRSRPRWLPRWLNIAFGIGADNLFAGTGYSWQADKNCTGPDCLRYELNSLEYPRTRQFFLSLDIDFTRLGVKNRFLRSVLGLVNIMKFPAPALELARPGKLQFHPVYF